MVWPSLPLVKMGRVSSCWKTRIQSVVSGNGNDVGRYISLGTIVVMDRFLRNFLGTVSNEYVGWPSLPFLSSSVFNSGTLLVSSASDGISDE